MGRPRTYVLFESSFRYERAPNISHETTDGRRTLCGRAVADAATVEPDSNDLDPDCIICRRAARRLRTATEADRIQPEAAITCSPCVRHTGQLARACGTGGCECYCNRGTGETPKEE